jgi:hypothetical protein
MNIIQKLSEDERQCRDRQRAMSIAKFCERYDIGRTKAYEEIKSGRLRARKIGTRTIITDGDAEDWLDQLPIVGPDTGTHPHQESASRADSQTRRHPAKGAASHV